MKTKKKTTQRATDSVIVSPPADKMPPPPPGEFKVVPHGKIRPDPHQPRKEFNQEKLEELAVSIKDQGIICPLVVQLMPATVKIEEPNLMHNDYQAINRQGAVVAAGNEAMVKALAGKDAEEFYQIIFGERRWRAAELAGLKEIPVIVRELTEREVFIHQFIENQARENLSHLEEAKAFTEQIAKRKESDPTFTADRLADELGIARGTVYNRLTLTRLIEPVTEALKTGKIQASVAGLIAMIPDPEQQEKLLKHITNEEDWQFPFSFRDVEEIIDEDYCKQLKDAPFDLKDPELMHEMCDGPGTVLYGGPCATCVARTGNMKAAFPHIKNVNVCTKPSCYQAKCRAHFRDEATVAEKKGQKVLESKEFKKVKRDYIPGDKHEYAHNRSGTFEKLMGKHAPDPVLVVTETGLQKFYPKEPAIAAAQKNGVKFRQAHTDADRKEEEEKRKKAEALRQSRESLAEGFMDKIATALIKLKDGDAWKLLAGQLEDARYMKVEGALLKRCKGDRGRVLAHGIAGGLRSVTEWETGKWNKEALALFKFLGIDLEAEEASRAPTLPLAKAEPQQKELLTVKKHKKKRTGGGG